MSYRMSFVTAGIGLGTVLAPLLVAFFGAGRAGYGRMSIAIGVLCGISMLTTFAATRRLPLSSSAPPTASLAEQLDQVRRNRPFVVLASSYVLMLTGLGVFGAAVPYYVTNILARQDAAIGYVFLAYLGGTLLSLPVWAALARRMGKARSLQIAAVLFFLPALLIFLNPTGHAPAILFAEVTALGVAFGGMQLLPFSMLTDTIQLDERRSGAQSGGAYSGIWTAGEKLGLAFGAAFMGLLLSVSGYVESTGEAVVQPESAMLAVRAAFTVGPALFVAAGLLLLPLYRLTERELVGPSETVTAYRPSTPSPPP
jgi:Na+/melibiose symporter-like transporter